MIDFHRFVPIFEDVDEDLSAFVLTSRDLHTCIVSSHFQEVEFYLDDLTDLYDDLHHDRKDDLYDDLNDDVYDGLENPPFFSWILSSNMLTQTVLKMSMITLTETVLKMSVIILTKTVLTMLTMLISLDLL